MLEWQRLTEHYREMTDDELRELAADFTDLTNTAQQVMLSEMQSRGLGNPGAASVTPELPRPAPIASPTPRPNHAPDVPDSIAGRLALLFGACEPELVPDAPPAGAEANGPVDYTWKTILCDCDTVEQARQIQEVLRRAGIESWTERPQEFSSTYARLTGLPNLQLIGAARPRILVAADQLDQARALAANPIPSEIVTESQAELPDFTPPSCPNCGAPDPILEGVDPVNSWKCEQCGRKWTDSVPAAAEKTGNAPAQPA
jgi:hypothetical protein